MAKPKPASPQPAAAPPSAPPLVGAGTHGPRTALAPTLVDMPKDAPNPVRDVAERTRQAVDNAIARAKEMAKAKPAEEPAAKEDEPPPKAHGSSKASSTTTDPESATGSSSEPTPRGESPSSDESGSADSDGGAGRGPRYELAAFKKWAREHPSEAAEIGEKVFQVGGDLRAEWIRIQNKSRKVRQQLAEERRSFEEERDAAKAEARGTAEVLTPIADLFEAVNGKGGERGAVGKDGKVDGGKVDFDAGDEAFKKLTGISIDDYMRARARKGISVSPEMRALKLENERLKKLTKVEDEPEKTDEPEPEKPKVKAKEAPKPKHDWTDEIGAKHGLRKIADWQSLLDAEMRRYYDSDLDEYNEDPEVVADKVLKRELAALAGEEEEPKPKPKPAPKAEQQRPKINARKMDDETPKPRAKPVAELPDDPAADAPKGWKERERWAVDRAMRRLRGETVE